MRLRSLRFIPIFLAALLAVFFGGLFYLLGTEPGTRWVVMQVASHAPGALHIGRIDGTLLGRLSLHQVEYRKEGTTLTLDKMAIEWRPIGLLAGQFRVKTLTIEKLRAELPSSSPRTEAPKPMQPTSPIRIPLAVTVEKAAIDGLAILSGESETRLDRVSFSGSGSGSEIQINSLEVASPAYTVNLKGRVALIEAYPFDATIAWSANPQDAQGENLKGEANIEGDLNRVHVVHRLAGPIPVETEGVFDIKKANGNLTGITIRSLHSSTLKGGVIDATGEASWSPHPSWELALAGSSLNPGVRWPDLDGLFSFEMNTKGRLEDQGVIGSFQLEKLTGTMRGHEVTASGGLDLEGETVRISRLTLQSGTARLTASGILSPRRDVAWSLNAPDLSHLLPEAGGRFAGKGKLQGRRIIPIGSADLEGSGLVWRDARIDSIKLRFLIDPEDRVESYIVLSARGLRKGEQTLDGIALNGKGKRAGHRINADLKAGRHRLALFIEGRGEETGWEGKLLRTVMSEEGFGQWNLEKPVAVSVKTDSAEIGEGCWKHENAIVCGKGRWLESRGWETSGHADRIPLGLMKPWIPDNIALSGTINGTWEASSINGTLASKTRWTPSNGKIEYITGEGDHLTIGYRGGYFQATLEDKSLKTETELTLAGQGRFHASLKLSPFDLGEDLKQSGLEGSANAEFSQLGLIAAFAPAVEKTEGKIRLDLTIGGTPEKPRIDGTVVLDQGSARIPALGLEIKQLQLTASGRKGETIAIEGTAQSGPGSIAIKGTVLLDAAHGWTTRLAIKGDRFQAANLPEVKLLASPDLNLAVQNRTIDLTGKILVPEATIKIKELPKGSAKVSEDVVIIQPGKKGEAAPWEINTKVTIQLGDKVKFNGFGLTGGILGQILVEEGFDRKATGEGELRVVNGRYEAYHQKMEIQNGRLIFTGPVDDPGIDVQAIKKIDLVTVGVRVTGTLKRPEITLFSDPPMDESNILSYLLFGTPFSKTNQSQGSGIMNEVQSGTTSSLEKASVGVGHYLSPRFYVGYGIGLFDSANSYRLRYQMTRTLALRAISGEENVIDLLYIKEFK